MGDRRMAEIRTEEGELYVYSHWAGHQLPELARQALSAAEVRRGDDPYALRIVLDQIMASGRDQPLGWGVMLKPVCEDEYNHDKPSVIVDLVNWKVTELPKRR